MPESQPSSRKGRILIFVLLGIMLLLIAIIIFLLLRGKNANPTILEPDYAAIDVEEGAKPMDDPDAEKAEVSAGGGSVTISFADNVSYSLSSRMVTLYYQNPYASTHNVVVQLILTSDGNEILLAQSGILAPGYELNSLKAEEDLPRLSEGGYSGKLRLLFYDPDTGERAIVDTDIPCTITVVA